VIKFSHIHHPLQLCLVITILIMVYAWADISARGTFRPRSKSDISARGTKRVKNNFGAISVFLKLGVTDGV
jgi:hypothetical protein